MSNDKTKKLYIKKANFEFKGSNTTKNLDRAMEV